MRKISPASDAAHKETDKKLAALERRLRITYGAAKKEAENKFKENTEAFHRKDAAHRADVASGKWTQEKYDTWRKNQLFYSDILKEKLDTIAEDFKNTDKIAVQLARGEQPDIYALNYNYGTYDVEHGAGVDTSFSLYDHTTVERLMRDDPELVPKPSPAKQAEIDAKDLKWNKEKLTSAFTASILNGDSIPTMAKKISAVADMDRNAAIRNARTMCTGAENAGRQDAYTRAEDMGIIINKVWMATHDGMTRDSHMEADGQEVGIHDMFSLKYGELEYPGDPGGPPAEVYNCRCTMVTEHKGFDKSKFTDSGAVENAAYRNMDFDEWQNVHADKPYVPISSSSDVLMSVVDTADNREYSITRRIEKDVELTNGTSKGFYQRRDCDVYTSDDGTEFYFPSDLDTSKQKITPHKAVTLWYKIPKWYREQIQKKIFFLDYRNPADKEIEEDFGWKDFRSFAVGGETINFFAWDELISDEEIIHTYKHEGAHYIDIINGNISESDEYRIAIKKDEKKSKKRYTSEYAEETQSVKEDFADGVAYYVDGERFRKDFTYRAEVYERVIGNGKRNKEGS